MVEGDSLPNFLFVYLLSRLAENFFYKDLPPQIQLAKSFDPLPF